MGTVTKLRAEPHAITLGAAICAYMTTLDRPETMSTCYQYRATLKRFEGGFGTDAGLQWQILAARLDAQIPDRWSDTAAEAVAASGVSPSLAADIVALTLSVVRGMALRTLWDNDPKWFDQLFAVWRRMIKTFLESQQPKRRAP